MANLKYGSTGDEVKQLQESLGFTGNDVDGIFGKKTQQAVIDYQKANGLTVDGIAGKNTLGKLYSTGSNNTGGNAGGTAGGTADVNTNTDAGEAKQPEFTYDSFQHDSFDAMGDEQIKQAWDILQQNQASKPGSYTPVWQDEADAYLSQYQNRDPFSYDPNSDALYLQAKDNYIQQGRMAMMDTMGQAAAMTGGYGNSYAQTAGQQAYNQHLTQLNEIVPELSQMAFDRYTQEGQELLAMYDLYMNREAQEYGRYQDSLWNWYQENAMLTDNYNTLYDRGWDKYLDEKNTAYDDYSTGRSEAFSQWQTQQNQKFQSEEAQKDRDFTASENEKSRAAAKKSTGGGGGQPQVEYKDLDVGSDAYNTIVTAVKKVADLGALKELTEQYLALGYNPDQINALTAGKAAELSGSETPTPDFTISPFWQKIIDERNGRLTV
jgi:hypothetical protein